MRLTLHFAVIPNLLGEKGDPNDPDSFFQRFIESHGLKGAVTPVKTQGLLAAREALLGEEKKADAIILFIALGNKTIRKLLTQNHSPAKLLPINVHAIESWHPFVQEAIHQQTKAITIHVLTTGIKLEPGVNFQSGLSS